MIEDAFRALVRDVVRSELPEILRQLRVTQADANADPGRYLTMREAGRFASVAAGTVRRWVRDGQLPGYGSGRLSRVKLGELDAFLVAGRTRARRQASVPVTDAEIERHVALMLAEDATRCARCRHLPKLHRNRGACYGKKCTCPRLVPP